MSVWYEQISEEGLRFAAVVDGGRVDPRHEHFMADSRDEARAWVDAAYIRKNTPKVKKPAEPVYVSELPVADWPAAPAAPKASPLSDDIQHHVLVPDGGVVAPLTSLSLQRHPRLPKPQQAIRRAPQTLPSGVGGLRR